MTIKTFQKIIVVMLLMIIDCFDCDHLDVACIDLMKMPLKVDLAPTRF